MNDGFCTGFWIDVIMSSNVAGVTASDVRNDATIIRFPLSIVQVGVPVLAVIDDIEQGFIPVPNEY